MNHLSADRLFLGLLLVLIVIGIAVIDGKE